MEMESKVVVVNEIRVLADARLVCTPTGYTEVVRE